MTTKTGVQSGVLPLVFFAFGWGYCVGTAIYQLS